MNNKQFNKIFFDFDSTLIDCESLDLLAEYKGIGQKVKEMTLLSMEGKVAMEDVFVEKINLLSPSKADFVWLIKQCQNLIVPGAIELISILLHLNKEVYILSSNFYTLILPISDLLRIKQNRVIANNIYFNLNSSYKGFDEKSPLVKSDGKLSLIKKYLNVNDCSIMIGDSVGDMMCQKAVSRFIGFGGVDNRLEVKNKSKFFVEEKNLLSLIPYILNDAEINKVKNVGLLNNTTTTTDKNRPVW